MINCDSMDKVVKELEGLAKALVSKAEQNEAVLKSISDMEAIAADLRKLDENNSNYVQEVSSLEEKYNTISTNIELALQDYKKIHSLFELQELEIKKMQGILESTIKNVAESNESIKKQIDKKDKFLLGGIIVSVVCTVVFGLITIFSII